MRRLLPLLLALAACGETENPIAAVALPIVRTAAGDEMVLIPAGSFEMGSARGRDDEKPVHRVSVDAFLMDRTEVTQAMYDRLREPNPSRFKGPTHPVEMIPWTKAALYCNRRSQAEGLKPCYNEDTAECDFDADGYRLPTEAEWEYACRARTETPFHFGETLRTDVANFKPTQSAVLTMRETIPAGGFAAANAFGLCDMHGNVREFCDDIYHDSYEGAPANGGSWRTGGSFKRVVRGGSFQSPTFMCRSAAREDVIQDDRLDDCGFRVVMEPVASSP